jgi:hypothetical protein
LHWTRQYRDRILRGYFGRLLVSHAFSNQGGQIVRKGNGWLQIGICLLTSLFITCTQKSEQRVITVLNPVGSPSPTPLIPMAPRIDTLDGKTIYIVDVMYPLTHQLFEEIQKVFSERYPRTTWVVKSKAGTYFDNDQKLWDEIKDKAQGVIIGVGH